MARSFPVIFLFLYSCLAVTASFAAESDGRIVLFPQGPLTEAFPVENMSTLNRLEVQKANKAPPGYPWTGYSSRALVDIRLGLELPFLGGKTGPWSWYWGFPLSVDFLTDAFQQQTGPVVNSDYWLGTRVEAFYETGIRWPANLGLSIIPFFHESTHLGDEFALHWSQKDSYYYRINVSYEAWDLAICLDEYRGADTASFTLRLGCSGRWNKDGYYPLPANSEFGASRTLADFHLSRGRTEYYLLIQTVVPKGFPAIRNWKFQGGLELRNRILLSYFTAEKEARVWTVTGSVGWFHYPESWKGNGQGIYLKLLYGQNPHGQLREQYGYFTAGFGYTMIF